MRAESFKEILLLVLLTVLLALPLLMFFIAVSVSATSATPPDNYVAVTPGGVFLLRGTITFDKPENGYFTWVMYWYNNGNADENFTVENISVYWNSDNTPVENVYKDDYEILNGHDVLVMDFDSAGRFGSIVRNGTFTIDVRLRAASGDGTPHKMENQWIYFSAGGKIVVYEPNIKFVDAPPIYVDLTAVTPPPVLPVGGTVRPVNKLALLAPWIVLAASIAIASASVAIYWRRR